ncbi:hypothetical protein [Halobacterium jilantaiense]|uniref:DUF8121 domain-containing protein n=1 Tax=Halobacterium jilantaiense TaxID=355548 RepID=A0A1I0QA54_9EURY|nr:hypothetical protein [Halobacterium jilantaiense]SEW23904.1 hypothetical protein SAMN04487945_2422 [Halobacterium jilantaiense]
MNRRTYLTTACGVGSAALAGCSGIAGHTTISDQTVDGTQSGRTTLTFADGDTEVGHLSVNGRVTSGQLRLPMEIWHQDGTSVDSIALRVWMPEVATESPAEVAVVSPVEGDSSPPPSVSLYTPERDIGTTIEVTDLDDLADETISTLDLIVVPGAESATDVNIHGTLELSGNSLTSTDYTLDGELQLTYPELAD